VTRLIGVDHVTIKDSGGYGVALRGYTAFTVGSAELTVTNSGKVSTQYPYPVRMDLNTTGSLPSGNYTGNQTDGIQLIGESPKYQVEIDDVIRDRGVPCRMGGNGAAGELRVGAVGSLPTLTIEPGVTIKIDSGAGTTGRVYVGIGNTTGQLVAVGSLRLYALPPSTIFQSSTIRHSLGHAILSAWTGAQVDLKTGNTFDSNVGCDQVIPQNPPNSTCPPAPACQ
jgi:hypothetical protein